MAEPLRVDAGELTAEEILDALRSGRRVVVRTEMLGGNHEITLRHDGSTYYCDTPTTLHKHAEEDEMMQCIRNMGYGKGDDGDD